MGSHFPNIHYLSCTCILLMNAFLDIVSLPYITFYAQKLLALKLFISLLLFRLEQLICVVIDLFCSVCKKDNCRPVIS